MAWSFGCQLAGGKDGGNCRIALRFQRNDDLSGPSVRRANNVCVAVEVCDINPRRTRRPQNQIERRAETCKPLQPEPKSALKQIRIARDPDWWKSRSECEPNG